MRGMRSSRRSMRCWCACERTRRRWPVSYRVPAVHGWMAVAARRCSAARSSRCSLLFARDAADMATIWWTSSTYEHCLVDRTDPRHGWSCSAARYWRSSTPRGVAGAARLGRQIGAVSWLLGAGGGGRGGAASRPRADAPGPDRRDARARRHRGALLFPLFYAIFLVPAGDGLVPPLQTITAWMCLALLHLSSMCPRRSTACSSRRRAGWFKVAEACSGAKFLIAMIALGVLVAHLGFRSWWRRAAFHRSSAWRCPCSPTARARSGRSGSRNIAAPGRPTAWIMSSMAGSSSPR